MDINADMAMKYRQQAKHIRFIADGVLNLKLQELMLKLAEDYERLARALTNVIVQVADEYEQFVLEAEEK